MAEYLLYCFQGPKFVRCDKFNAADDAAAIQGLSPAMTELRLSFGAALVR